MRMACHLVLLCAAADARQYCKMVDHSCIKVETVLGPMLTESHNEFGVPGAKVSGLCLPLIV